MKVVHMFAKNKKIILRIFASINKKYKIVIVIGMVLFSAVISIIQPLVSRGLFDKGIIGRNLSAVVILSVILFGLSALNNVVSFLEEMVRCDIKNELTLRLFDQFIKKINRIHIEYFTNNSQMEVYVNMHNDITNIASLVNSGFFVVVNQCINIIGGIIGLMLINWKLAILVLIIVPFKYSIVKLLSKRRSKAVSEYMMGYSELSKKFEDFISGIKEVRIYNLFNKMGIKLTQNEDMLLNLEKKMDLQLSLNSSMDQLLLQGIHVVIYIVGAVFVMNGSITIGGLMAFATYSSYVITPVSSLLNIGILISSILPAAYRYFDFLDLEQEEILFNEKKAEIFEIMELEFEKVQFSYGNKRILKEISFQLHKGDIAMFIGENGSGKSTILNLIIQFLKPERGKIYCNGLDINTIDLLSYRKSISVVGPDSHIFNDTIENNIKLNETLDDNTLDKIIELTYMKSFIKEYGKRTLLENNGCNISTGQRQKILLARAIAHQSQIIILDEATANLDEASRTQIYNMLRNEFLRDKMVIIVTHNNDIDFADYVFYLKNGTLEK